MKLALKLLALLLVSVVMMSCRGQKTDKPPIRHHFNMNFQERFNAQQENQFFEDGMAMRMPVEGTVARGMLRHDTVLFEGVDDSGEYVDEIPFELTREFLNRGRERYDVYCQMCHGGTGDGQGIIMTGGYGYVPAPTFHSESSRNMPDGEFYSAIANGIRNMPAYATQINVEDRWAIVAYVRALQASQNVREIDMDRYDVDLAELRDLYEQEQARLEAIAAARSSGASDEVTAERGERLYIQNACQACHSLDGRDGVGPTFAGLYGAERNFTDGTSAIADEDYLIESILEPEVLIVEGYDNVMVPYTHLNESELQSLVEFIRSLSDE
ncbi:MAG: c-type cytochrome [Balneolaceae bacterium]|nr:c-type cytochrome [Balneolaceae bacterium]